MFCFNIHSVIIPTIVIMGEPMKNVIHGGGGEEGKAVLGTVK